MRPGHQHPHGDPRARRIGQGRQEGGSGREVGRRHVDARPGGGDREEEERLQVAVADPGARAHGEHRRPLARDRLELGQVVFPGDDLAGRLEPVLRERPLQATDHRPLDPDVRVAPVLGVLRVAGPLVRDADAPGEGDAAVGQEELAVGAVVAAPDGVGPGRTEAADTDPGLLHPGDQVGVHLDRPHGVEEDAALDPRGRALAERIGELPAISPRQ